MANKFPNKTSFIEHIIRPNILRLQPYRCARDDFQTGILLDANENALGPSIPPSALISSELVSELHRYPDPHHFPVKAAIAKLRNLPSPDCVFLGVGSDEVIDLIIRVTCEPAKEAILVTPPTYGMYSVCAQVNDVHVVKVNLDISFRLRVEEIQKAISENPSIKLIFLCSPGNPTGTLISLASITKLLELDTFKGLVVVDEAYIDFSGTEASATGLISQYPNLCVIQTLSKSFGLAGIRLGMALAQPPLIQILANTKAPYNLSNLTAQISLSALSDKGVQMMNQNVEKLVRARAEVITMLDGLRSLGLGSVIGGNNANFVLVPVLKKNGDSRAEFDNERSMKIYNYLAEVKGVVVRYRGSEFGCGGCLRITIGTDLENQTMLSMLEEALRIID